MVFSYASGAQSVLNCTSLARTATRASVVGTAARIEIEGSFYAPTSFSVVQRDGTSRRYRFDTQGRGLHYQVDEVARCLREGLLESPAMPLDETIEIMDTMERVLALG